MNKKTAIISFFVLISSTQLNKNSMIQAMQLAKKHKALSSISNDSLTTLYQWVSLPSIDIPLAQLIDSCANPINLKELFNTYGLVTGYSSWTNTPSNPWSNEDWAEAYAVLKKRAEGKEGFPMTIHPKISLEKLGLLPDARSILKSFLPADGFTLAENLFVKKSGQLGRLFTYARLQRAIDDKKLSHVHLPRKFLVIKDKKTGIYLKKEASERVLDDIIKIFVFYPSVLETRIAYYTEDYELSIFAEKQEKYEIKLNQAARNDLKVLTEEAPFDVGIDNIFADSHGDAIIIDTEFKGESATSSVQKLERYFQPS